MATNALSIDQIKFKANNAWNGLDEVRLYNGTDALYCKEGVTTGLLMQGNQLKIVNVTWNAGVPAVTVKGYIDAQGDYHSLYKSDGTSASTSLQTLRESVNNSIKNITRSGTTFTATRCDNTTFTFTQQDNNSLTGVKGNAESSYRTGNVNLTPANIGAQPSGKYVTYSNQASKVDIETYNTNTSIVITKTNGTQYNLEFSPTTLKFYERASSSSSWSQKWSK